MARMSVIVSDANFEIILNVNCGRLRYVAKFDPNASFCEKVNL